jgi:predicted peptidase
VKGDAGKRYPLVIFLHGAGERGTDNLKPIGLGGRMGAYLWTLPENQERHPCFVAAPQCPDNDKWAEVQWGDGSHALPAQPTDAMRLAMGMIDGLMKELPIDPDRVYVTGLSMGGYGTWDLLSRRPGTFAAAIPVCGGLADDQAGKIAHIPQWIFHGGNDTVVKTIRSRNAYEQLKAAGAPSLRYTEFGGVGHNSWDLAFSTPGLANWLMSKKRAGGNGK